MIVADTNVLSEPLRRAPDARVMEWLAVHSEEIALTSITVGELLYGALRLAEGRRRQGLVAAIEALVSGADTRVLGYDQSAARAFGALRAGRVASGHSVGVEDTMIAAICQAGGHAIATRNVRDFADVGLEIHDPWTA